MGRNATGPERAAQRPRGRKAGLDLPMILSAARSVPKEKLSMQAVADVLHVDRKALNHHVADRQTLLALVAGTEFATAFTQELRVADHSDWRSVAHAYALSFAKGITSTGVLADHLRFDASVARPFLDATELLLGKLVGAGLDRTIALRSLVLLTNMCMAFGRDVAIAERDGVHHRSLILNAALHGKNPLDLPILFDISQHQLNTYDMAQLEFGIQATLTGHPGTGRTRPRPGGSFKTRPTSIDVTVSDIREHVLPRPRSSAPHPPSAASVAAPKPVGASLVSSTR